MNKKIILVVSLSILFLLVGCLTIFNNKKTKDIPTSEIVATILSSHDNKLTIQDKNNGIYTFNSSIKDANAGDNIIINYSGILNKEREIQDGKIVSYSIVANKLEDNIPESWMDNGLFSNFYTLAYNKLKTMSLNDKIGQLFIVRYHDKAVENTKKYGFGGFVFFEKDFQNKTFDEVKNMIKNVQNASNIPLITSTDEEGGKIVRVSSNPNLVPERFKSSKDLYSSGGFEAIKNDTINKSKVLYNLGLNVNLAPVADVSTNQSDYIYERSFGKDTSLTSSYIKTVIDASKGLNVSYTLKHFPGYGNSSDTHNGGATNSTSLEDIKSEYLPPFDTGIKNGAEAVLVSHTIYDNIDKDNPASLSASVHNILRNDLDFTGIVMTDDLDMGATNNISEHVVKALLAGNDMLIVTDYESSINEVKNAISNGKIDEDLINKLSFKILAWKYYKGLLYENQK